MILIVKSSHLGPYIGQRCKYLRKMKTFSCQTNIRISVISEYSPWRFFFMYNRYLAPSNCENRRHGSVSGCRNRIFSVIDNCSASGQLLIDSFQFSVLFLSLLFFRDGEKKKMSDRKDLENMSIMLRRRKKKAFCKNFNDFEDSKNIKINVSRILSKDIRKDINM